MDLFDAREDHVREVVALVQFVLTRFTNPTLLLVKELVHAMITSWCIGLVTVQRIGWEIDRSDFILKHVEVLKTLMGASQLRSIIACKSLFLFSD